MDTLDAVNLILRKIGEIPVTRIDEQYPTLAIALPALEEARIAILSEGYWFNTFYKHILQPDVNGEVPVPLGCLKFFPDDPKFTWVGDRVVLQDTGSLIIGEEVPGRLINDVAFDSLPEVAQYAIAYQAAYDTYLGDIGPDATLETLNLKRQQYLEQIGGDHTTTRQHNSKTRKQQQRWRQQLWT